MKVLVIADQEARALWDYYDPKRLEGIDLIISCGDLDPDYLEFLVTMKRCPLLYVRGNHDSVYDQRPPEGCVPIDDRIYDHHGIRILGLGGCLRYRPGSDMYTEREMRKRICRLRPALAVCGGIDILVTHAPARGWGDQEDLPHRGFECLGKLLQREKPVLMLHGHVHKEYGRFRRELHHPCGTRIINGFGYYIIELDENKYGCGKKAESLLYRWYMRWLWSD